MIQLVRGEFFATGASIDVDARLLSLVMRASTSTRDRSFLSFTNVNDRSAER
jgi:hypothetical protein